MEQPKSLQKMGDSIGVKDEINPNLRINPETKRKGKREGITVRNHKYSPFFAPRKLTSGKIKKENNKKNNRTEIIFFDSIWEKTPFLKPINNNKILLLI
ncbi:MAG: hypothetical protein II992_01590 [Lachnospiraceae bacterium]|nr:hypothetical protein [Lachnospiraceae bacterium]MBQ7066123.1 hypothetical protein [Lachnospiraceae bacterium]